MDYLCTFLLFQIYYKPNKSYLVEDFDTSTRSIDTPDNSTGFTITGLIPATNYTVYLSAFTEAGEGSISVKITNFTSFDGTYVFVYTYIHTYIHTYTHTYIYIYVCMYCL